MSDARCGHPRSEKWMAHCEKKTCYNSIDKCPNHGQESKK